MKDAELKDIVGLTMKDVRRNNDDETITFEATNGKTFKMYHRQDCCEDVHIEDICGNLADLVDTPIITALVSTNDMEGGDGEPITWTFYRILTAKGSVVIRWYGTSNGYYGTEVDFEEV